MGPYVVVFKKDGSNLHTLGHFPTLEQAAREVSLAKHGHIYMGADKKTEHRFGFDPFILVKTYDSAGNDVSGEVEKVRRMTARKASNLLLDSAYTDEFLVASNDKYKIAVVAGDYGDGYAVEVGWFPATEEMVDPNTFKLMDSFIFSRKALQRDAQAQGVTGETLCAQYADNLLKQLKSHKISGYAQESSELEKQLNLILSGGKTAKSLGDVDQSTSSNSELGWLKTLLNQWYQFRGHTQRRMAHTVVSKLRKLSN